MEKSCFHRVRFRGVKQKLRMASEITGNERATEEWENCKALPY